MSDPNKVVLKPWLNPAQTQSWIELYLRVSSPVVLVIFILSELIAVNKVEQIDDDDDDDDDNNNNNNNINNDNDNTDPYYQPAHAGC